MDNSDRQKVLDALGGKRGLIDNGIPSILFLIVFNISHTLNTAIWASLSLSAVFTVIRIIRRETLQHAISGLIGVLICAVFARHSGKATDFYLPSLYKNAGFALLYAFTNLAKWPLLGVTLGPILGENFAWRMNHERRRVYTQAGWLWFGMFVLRLAIQIPLYKANALNALGVANVFLGFPLYLLVLWGTWLIIRSVPVAKDLAKDSPKA